VSPNHCLQLEGKTVSSMAFQNAFHVARSLKGCTHLKRLARLEVDEQSAKAVTVSNLKPNRGSNPSNREEAWIIFGTAS